MMEKRPGDENTSPGSADQLPDRQRFKLRQSSYGVGIRTGNLNESESDWEEPGVKTKAPSSLRFNSSFDSFGFVSERTILFGKTRRSH